MNANNENKRVTPESLGGSLKSTLRKSDEPDRVFPKNRKVEVVFLVEAVNAILPRTEGVEDITLIKLPGTEYEVPIILPEKLQAVARRKMLNQLRWFRDNSNKMKEYLEKVTNMYKYEVKKRNKKGEVVISFIKAKEAINEPKNWNCYIQPPGGDVRETTDVGMDGFCPACALFGTVITNVTLEFLDTIDNKNKNVFGESVGVKSRVEFDPAITFLDKEKSVAKYTHSKVADGVSWTGMGLYSDYHVIPGTIFVGKVTLEDVTEAELKAFLAVLSSIDRLGGRERLYGGVRVYLIGIKGGSYETASALEIARKLAEKYGGAKYPPAIDEVIKKTTELVKEKRFTSLDTNAFKNLMDNTNVWEDLWSDTVKYDRQIVKRILDLIRGSEKYEEASR